MSETSRREYSYESLVVKADPNHYKSDEVVYEFGNGRCFINDDNSKGGVYGDFSTEGDDPGYRDAWGDRYQAEWDAEYGESW